MRTPILPLCVAFAIPAPALADTHPVQAVPLSAVLYQDDVILPRDAGNPPWHRVSYNVTPQENIQEYVPEGQTGADWTQIITVKVLPLSRKPKDIVEGTISFLRGICGQVKIINTSSSQRTGESAALDIPLPIYDSSEELVTCENPSQAKLTARLGAAAPKLHHFEVTWYRLMQGSNANYIVQRAWHGDKMDETSPLGSDAVLATWKQWISRITLRRRETEAK